MVFMRSLGLFLGLSLMLCLLAGCGPQLRQAPGQISLNLSGQWRLAEGSYDAMTTQLRTAIEQAQAKQDARDRRRMRREAPEGDSLPPPEGAVNPAGRDWQRRDRDEQLDALLATVVPAHELLITQRAPDNLDIQPDSSAVRRLETLQDSTLVNKFATLRIHSGWQGDAFLIYSADSTQGLQIVERYQRAADQLKVQVQFKMSGVKQQTLNVIYRLQS